ncbi:MAG: RidA family protein [Kordiimonadaceae bacterium]|nr:RidA family protein [Kordiimonadaceae bacterium]
MKKIFSILLITLLASFNGISTVQAADTLEDRLAKELVRLGFEDGKMPPLSKVFGPYQPFVVVDKDIYLTSTAAQRPDGTWMTGLVTAETDLDQLIYATELSVISALNRLKFAADGDLNRIGKIIHVNTLSPAPHDYPHLELLADTSSDMLVRVFGPEIGSHARTILSVTSLPINMHHEIEVRARMK